MEADIPGGRSEGGRLRLWSALPQKGGWSGTGHMNCSCHNKPFLPDLFPEQLQGNHSFGWACATQHIPKVFVSAQLVLLRRNTLAVWPCCARGVSVQQNHLGLPYCKQLEASSYEQKAWSGLVEDGMCEKLRQWDCRAHLPALRGNLHLPEEESQFKMLSLLCLYFHRAQLSAGSCKLLCWSSRAGANCEVGMSSRSAGFTPGCRNAPWQQTPLPAEPCGRGIPLQQVWHFSPRACHLPLLFPSAAA